MSEFLPPDHPEHLSQAIVEDAFKTISGELVTHPDAIVTPYDDIGTEAVVGEAQPYSFRLDGVEHFAQEVFAPERDIVVEQAAMNYVTDFVFEEEPWKPTSFFMLNMTGRLGDQPDIEFDINYALYHFRDQLQEFAGEVTTEYSQDGQVVGYPWKGARTFDENIRAALSEADDLRHPIDKDELGKLSDLARLVNDQQI